MPPPQQGLGTAGAAPPRKKNGHVPLSNGFTIKNEGKTKENTAARAAAATAGKSKTGVGAKAKADPFSVPDNDYADSFLDSLWINLLSSRMSVAVEAEARTGAAAKKNSRTSIGGGSRIGEGESASDSSSTGASVAAERERSQKDGGGAASIGIGPRTAPAPPVSGVARVSGKDKPTVGGGGMGGGYTYEDYVALATRLQAGAPERQRQVVRGVLRSLFPAWFPAFYRTLFPRSKVCGPRKAGWVGDFCFCAWGFSAVVFYQRSAGA